MIKKKVLASICMIFGVAIMAIPFFYHFKGQEKTDALLTSFEKNLEDITNDGERQKTPEEQTRNNEEEATLFGEENVIGIIEIEKIDIKLPIVEGADDESIKYAIGHISETASIGTKGNCVLAGHNGSRNGTYFTHLNKVLAGDIVKLIDVSGTEYLYAVEEMFVTEANNNAVKDQGEQEVLTLITCAEKGTKRLIVRCTSVKGGD